MGVKEIYFAVEDKYYAGLDWLDHHGIPIYKVVDAIEAQNIPSFPLAAFLLLLVAGGLLVGLSGGFGGGSALNVLIQDDTQTPLRGVSVQLEGEGLSGDARLPKLTNEAGMVTFANLPPGTLVRITAEADDFEILAQSIVLDAGTNETELVAQPLLATHSILLHLYKSGTTESFTDAIQIQFACSNNAGYAPNPTVTSGQIALDVPGDCGTLTATPSSAAIQFADNTIDVENAQPALHVQNVATGNGVLRVNLINESGNGISGLTTYLKSKFGDQLATKFSDADGLVEFTGLVPDSYVIFTSADGTYGEFDSGLIEVDDGAPIVQTFTIQHASVGEVRVQLVDESSLAPVGNAKVTLSRGNQSISTKTTNEGGQVTFTVSAANSLSISVDHPAYLIKTGFSVNVSSAGYTQVPMTKATLQNSQIVTVMVTDELGQPVEDAYVALKKSPTGASVGTNKITGTTGTVSFSALEEGTYFASAYKPGFSDQLRSDIFTVRARENVSVSVKLVLGNGTMAFNIMGADGQPLAGATVQPVDGVSHANIGDAVTTGVDGGAELTLRADKYAYFVIDEPNHLPYVTTPHQTKKGITQTVNVTLVKDIPKLEIKPLGTFVNGTPVLETSGLAPGQTYTVRFGLFVPANSVFNETGVHIRAGNSTDGQTNPVENDDWVIHAVRGAFAKVQRGTTYTPPAGVGIDSQHLTSADSKWVNLTFTPAREGLTIVEVDLLVKDTTTQGADLPLYYRAWGKTGSYVRYPVDAVLGGSESVSEKQGLYANANVQLYSAGAGTHLCSNSICLGLVAEDLGQNLQTPLTSDYETDLGTKHRLLFTFTSISDNVFADTSLILQSTSASATLKAYDVTNAVGAKKTGTVAANRVEIPVGIIQTNNVVFGFVNVDAMSEGSSRVKLSLVSNKKELFARELLVKVNAAGIMSVDVIPKAILPLLVNQLLVHVTQGADSDSLGLENTGVSITVNGTLLTSGITDTDGVFAFELHEPAANDSVEIRAEKAGYAPVVKTIKVGADIVGFNPEQVSETLIVNGTARKTRDVRIFNLSSVPLTISEISLSGDFDDLVRFELLNDEVLGETLGTNADRNITFALSLTDKGQRLLNGRTFKGSLVVKTTLGETEKLFVNTLPLNVKLGFGGEVDLENCLLIDPAAWDIYADPGSTKQVGVELKNTCTVKGVPVKLTNLSAKVKQISGDTVGVFSATTGQKNTELGTEYRLLLNEISAGETVTVTLGFIPNTIESGTAKPEIVFQVTNLTDNGVPDQMNATLKTNIVINALTKCVQVNTPTELSIDSCPINLGSGQYGNYFNQTYRPTGVPYYNPGYGVINQTSNPSGSSLLPSSVSGGYGSYYGAGPVNGAYGASGYDGLGNYSPSGAQFSPVNQGAYAGAQGYYNNPGVDRYNYGGGVGGQFGGCGTAEIRIENSCQSPVEIQLDADPNLQTSANAFVLQPNQSQRIRIASGYRIGKYSVAVNAHVKGSQDASTEVSLVDVLVKSPTEVNADCIVLDRDKFKFNDFIQKPIKGKIINKCYDAGVRLVPSADTITIASFFSGPDQVTPTNKGSTSSARNSMVQDIQLIGVQTVGSGRDTIQELEFQVFPDFETYKRLFNPVQGGGLGQQISDLKFFAEGQFYRVESYGTISVKYLDPFGGGQQKPFPVIFENLWKLAPLLDLGEGSPDVVNYQECINPNALQFRNTGSTLTSTNNRVELAFDDADFANGSSLTTYVTASPNEVLIADDAHCGGRDELSDLKTLTLTNPSNPGVQATFTIADRRNIQVTVNRPATLANDVVIQGTLRASLTRVAVNAGTQEVSIPVRIVVKHGKATSSSNYALFACTEDGYENGDGFAATYGFDKLSWDWTFDGSPSCDTFFCDATQVALFTGKKVKEFNTFVRANAGIFIDASKSYTTQNFVKYIHETVSVTDTASSPAKVHTFFLSHGRSSLVDVPTGTAGKSLVTSVFGTLKADESFTQADSGYVTNVMSRLAQIDSDPAGKNVLASTIILLNESKLGTGGVAIVKAFGGESIAFDGARKKMVWMVPEFRAMMDKLSGGVMISMDQSDAITTTGLNSESITVSMNDLKAIYSAIESVIPAYSIPSDDAELSTLSATQLAYLVQHAQAKNGLNYGAYGSANGLREQFIDTKWYLLPDSFSPAFFSDLMQVSGEGYEYATAFDAQSGEAGSTRVRDTIRQMKVGAGTQTFTVPGPGLYDVRFLGAFDNGGIKTDGLTVTISTEDAKRKTLEEWDEDHGTSLAENPFLYLSFNGKTGSGPAGRIGYGVGIDLVTADGASGAEKNVKFTHKTLAIDSAIGGGKSTVAVNTHSTLASLASFVNQKGEGLPALFRLARGTNGYVMDYAPSVPVPLRATFGNPSGLATVQYGFLAGAQRTTYEDLAASPILWTDCTKTNRTLVSATNNPSCFAPQANHQSLNPDGAGNTFTYAGVALVPASGDYFLGAQCALASATIQGPTQTIEIDNQADTQIQTIALKNTKATKIESLRDMLTAIASKKACGKIEDQSFRVIWDMAQVTPAALTCAGK